VRHVVALDAQRRLGQPQQILQLGDRAAARVVVAGATQAVAHELLASVASDGLVQLALVATLRDADLHTAAAQVSEPLLVGGRVVGRHRHQHLLGHPRRRVVAVQRLQDAIDETTRRELLHLVEHEPLAPDHPALAHEEHLHGRFQLVVGDTDHVDVFAALGNHLLLLDGLAHCQQPVAQACRPLVLQLLGRTGHLGLEPLDDLVGVAIEEVAQLLHQLAVRHLLDLAHARATALLDVEQQARPTQPVMLVELARAARTDGEAAQQQVERVADGVCVRVRPEVAGALALATAHHQRTRILLVERDREERVALVVAQPHVEARAVELDEAELQHQGFHLVAHLDPLHRRGGGHHLSRTRMHVARVLEVVGESLTKAGSLAHVDDAPLLVLELI